MTGRPAYSEILDFLAGGTTPESLLAFHPSAAAQERMEYLLERNRDGALTPDEQQELDETLQLEHLMILIKAHARQKRTLGAG